jgi:hypothetical protein
MDADFLGTISSRCDHWLWRMYECAPQSGLDVIGTAFRYSLPLMRQRVPVTVYHGATHAEGTRGKMVIAGNNPWLEDLKRRFFSELPQALVTTHCPVWALPDAFRQYEASADLIVGRVDRLTSRVLFGSNWLRVPEWVDCQVNLPDDISAIFQDESVRSDLRRIHRSGITRRFSYSEKDFERFYNEFHAPFVRRRHGEQVHLRNIHRLRRMFRRGGLMWIERENRAIAGLLFERQPGRFRMIVVGMKGDDKRLMGQGVPSASYYFSILQAQSEGRRILDMGGVRPILNDGVLKFKRKWSARMVDKRDIYHDYVVRLNEQSPAVIDFLSRTPLIYQDRRELSAITSMPRVAVKNGPPLGYPVCPGLRRLTVLNARDSMDAIAGSVPQDTEIVLR